MFVFFNAGVQSLSNAHFGRGDGLILLSYVGCSGEEESLLNCTRGGFGINYCSHYEDAGVRCPGIVRTHVQLHLHM